MTAAPHWQPGAVRPALEREGIALREWQRRAAWACMQPGAHEGVVCAIMGAGKSVVLGCLAAAWDGPVLVTAPSIELTDQLAATIARITGEDVGRVHTRSATVRRVTVACMPSVPQALSCLPPGPLLLLVDEAHRAEGADWLAHPRVVTRIGMTATAYRAAGGLARWGHLLYRYGIEQALADGVLLEPVVDLVQQGADDIDQTCADWIAARTGPGVVSALDIEDAEAYADRLRGAGVAAEALHSRMPARMRGELLGRLRDGGLRCIVHVRMLVEGVDMPWLEWLCLRASRGSRVAYAQEIGRVMRWHPGKERPLVLDPHRVTLAHSLQGPAELGAALMDAPSARPGELAEPPPLMLDPMTGEPFATRTERQIRRARALSDAAVYIMQAARVFAWAGLAGQPAPSVKDWRSSDITPAQARAIDGAVRIARGIMYHEDPPAGSHRRAVCRMVIRAQAPALAARMRRGYASDLLTVWRLVGAREPETHERAAAELDARDIATPDLEAAR